MGLRAASVRTGRKFLLYGKPTTDELRLISDKVARTTPSSRTSSSATSQIPHSPAAPEYRFERREVAAPRRERRRACSQISQDWVPQPEPRGDAGHPASTSPSSAATRPTSSSRRSPRPGREHCVHKTLPRHHRLRRARRSTTCSRAPSSRATRGARRSPGASRVFKDNAGVIEFDDEYNVCFKVETHNHPSRHRALRRRGHRHRRRHPRPARHRPRRQAHPEHRRLLLRPARPAAREACRRARCTRKRVMKGVVAGVRDYGNRMGIPTVNGAVYFDERYVGNPLVYCGNVGLIPRDKCAQGARGRATSIVVVGGRTGRDGIHGATFSSRRADRGVRDGLRRRRADRQPHRGEEDDSTCSSQARDRGPLHLHHRLRRGRPLQRRRRDGRGTRRRGRPRTRPAQVRGPHATPRSGSPRPRSAWSSPCRRRTRDAILEALPREDVEATVIGRFTGDRAARRSATTGDRSATSTWTSSTTACRGSTRKRRRGSASSSPSRTLPRTDGLRPRPQGASSARGTSARKEWVIRQYDHEVQGASVLKPLVGVANDGPGDAAVIAPVLGSRARHRRRQRHQPEVRRHRPLLHGRLAPSTRRCGTSSPSAADSTASRSSTTSAGATPTSPTGSARSSARREACYDVAKAYGTPFISGKDSLNNEFRVGDGRPSPSRRRSSSAPSASSDDVRKVRHDGPKSAGNIVYVVGLTQRRARRVALLRAARRRRQPRARRSDAAAARATFERARARHRAGPRPRLPRLLRRRPRRRRRRDGLRRRPRHGPLHHDRPAAAGDRPRRRHPLQRVQLALPRRGRAGEGREVRGGAEGRPLRPARPRDRRAKSSASAASRGDTIIREKHRRPEGGVAEAVEVVMNWRLDDGQIEVVDDAMAEVLRLKMPWERVAMIAACHRTMRCVIEGCLRTEHPNWPRSRLPTGYSLIFSPHLEINMIHAFNFLKPIAVRRTFVRLA